MLNASRVASRRPTHSLNMTQTSEAINLDSDSSDDEELVSSDDGFLDDTPVEFDGFVPVDDNVVDNYKSDCVQFGRACVNTFREHV